MSKQTEKNGMALEIELKVNADEIVSTGKALQVGKALTWRGCRNTDSILRFDRDTNTILVDKQGLMNAIRVMNPRQVDRDILLVDRLIEKSNQIPLSTTVNE